MKPKLNLDIGCGANCQPGFVGMDKRALPGVELIHDAEIFPWPVEAESVSVLMMSHFIEHVKPWLQFELMDEAWRVLLPEGQLMISTPYGGSFRWHQDPTHCTSWNECIVLYFVPGEALYNIYTPKPWRVEHLFWDVRGDLEVVFKKLLNTTA